MSTEEDLCLFIERRIRIRIIFIETFKSIWCFVDWCLQIKFVLFHKENESLWETRLANPMRDDCWLSFICIFSFYSRIILIMKISSQSILSRKDNKSSLMHWSKTGEEEEVINRIFNPTFCQYIRELNKKKKIEK